MNKYVSAIEEVMEQLRGKEISCDFERNTSPAAQLPDTFIVWLDLSDEPESWGDGKERYFKAEVQVSIFYRNKETYLTLPAEIDAMMEKQGFQRISSMRAAQQTDTGHYARYCRYNFYERRS